MTGRVIRSSFLILSAVLSVFGLSSCGTEKDTHSQIFVSVRDQRLLLTRDGKAIKAYRVSTSKFGIGDKRGSNYTPLGRLEVAKKIGDSLPAGAVFKGRRPTGEIVKPNAPGRDPIVSRILWLRGTESNNKLAFGRCIYIHGTAEEWRLGVPASYGCIRMASKDVIDLYRRIGEGAEVNVLRESLKETDAGRQYAGTVSVRLWGES
jgi:lipoprotein-anchoring transpeptidase ErfK/SrfK